MQVNAYSLAYSVAQNSSTTNTKQPFTEPQEIISSGQGNTVSISVEAQQLQELEYTPEQSFIDKLRYGDLNTYESMSLLEKANQAVLDNRIGLDREKIEEINQKMEDIIHNKSMSSEEKSGLLSQLEKEKEAEYEKVAEKITDQAKSELTNKKIDDV